MRRYNPGMAIPTDKCLHCGSTNVVTGVATGHNGIMSPGFVADKDNTLLKRLFDFDRLTIRRNGCMCADCHLFWSEIANEDTSIIEV